MENGGKTGPGTHRDGEIHQFGMGRFTRYGDMNQFGKETAFWAEEPHDRLWSMNMTKGIERLSMASQPALG